MNVVVNVVYFFVFFVGSVECRRCFEGVLSSDVILKDCMTNQPSFSQVLLTYTRVEPTKLQLGPTDQSFDQVFLNGTLTRTRTVSNWFDSLFSQVLLPEAHASHAGST